MKTASPPSGGIGFFGLLAILFIALRLTGVIAWPWIWVLAPFWGPIALCLTLAVLFGALALMLG